MQSLIIILISMIGCYFAIFLGSRWSQLKNDLLNKSAQWISLIGAFATLAGLVYAYQLGTLELSLYQWEFAEIGFRLDALNGVIALMICIIGWVILRFSSRYMAGANNEKKFIGSINFTIAAVLIMVLSNNLFLLGIGWILSGTGLIQLISCYGHRVSTKNAAKKARLAAIASNLALTGAIVLAYVQYQTINLEQLFALVDQEAMYTSTGILFLVAVAFKSAQFPVHSWLLDIIEAPTPVSAILHAGLLNAGPYLIIRVSPLIHGNVQIQNIILIVGGLSATFGSIVYMTQKSVKTSLTFSSIGHMGFSLFICGLGIYSAALLHLVGHSFYKAYSFLSAGEQVQLNKQLNNAALNEKASFGKNIVSLILAIGIVSANYYLWSQQLVVSLGLVMLCIVITLGIYKLLSDALNSAQFGSLLFKNIAFGFGIAFSFFLWEAMMHHMIESQVPAALQFSKSTEVILGLYLTVFLLIIAKQTTHSSIAHEYTTRAMVHIKNGFYVHMLLDRWLGLWSHHKKEMQLVPVERKLQSVEQTHDERTQAQYAV